MFLEGSKVESVLHNCFSQDERELLERNLVACRQEIGPLIETGTGDHLDQAAQMIQDVFEKCFPEKSRGRYCFGTGRYSLGIEVFQTCISELLTHSNYKLESDTKMKKRLDNLMQIPFKAILTTNFDTIIPGNQLISNLLLLYYNMISIFRWSFYI